MKDRIMAAPVLEWVEVGAESCLHQTRPGWLRPRKPREILPESRASSQACALAVPLRPCTLLRALRRSFPLWLLPVGPLASAVLAFQIARCGFLRGRRGSLPGRRRLLRGGGMGCSGGLFRRGPALSTAGRPLRSRFTSVCEGRPAGSRTAGGGVTGGGIGRFAFHSVPANTSSGIGAGRGIRGAIDRT